MSILGLKFQICIFILKKTIGHFVCHKDDLAILDWVKEATYFLRKIHNSVDIIVNIGIKEMHVSEVQ